MVFAVADDGMGPDDSKRPLGEVKIQIIVPEEFIGVALHELITRQGLITAMEAEDQHMVIRASLPAREYDRLVEAIVANTDRGRVERE
jgi:translation elongation factor EF-G